jgi:hypothetical protein
MHIRTISEDDLNTTLRLLCEGFPRRREIYWRLALERLRQRPQIAGCPRFGYLVECDNAAQGVILLISVDFGRGLRTNVSSWYVRPNYRKYAIFLLQRALKAESETFLDLTPAAHVLPIVRGFGFIPYTGGTILLGPDVAIQRGARVYPYNSNVSHLLSESVRALAKRHLSYGCTGLIIDDIAGPELALCRTKWIKHLIPAARFIYGSPQVLMRNAGSLMRTLHSRGIPLALVDAPLDVPPQFGYLMEHREIRYYRGAMAPEPGDLADSEIAIFGP